MNTRTRDSFGELFKDVTILLMYSQYTYSLILYTVNIEHLYNTYNAIHKYRTRYNYNLRLPIVSLSQFNKGAYFSEIKVFNYHPEYIK